jgi:hypothetical protein
MDSHNLEGILLFCWPVGLAMWMFYVYLLERPTIELLPEPWRSRVPMSDRNISFRNLALGSISVIVGAITHVLWDAFTHGSTFITLRVPALNTVLFQFEGRNVRVFFMLQVLSSIAGLFALWLWALNLRKAEPRPDASHEGPGFITNRTRILALLSIVVVSGVMALLGYLGNAGDRLEERVFYFLIGGMAGAFLAWCGIAILVSRTARAAQEVR